MPYTIYISETNVGHVTFSSKEEAEDWLNEPDYDLVKWTDTIDGSRELVED